MDDQLTPDVSPPVAQMRGGSEEPTAISAPDLPISQPAKPPVAVPPPIEFSAEAEDVEFDEDWYLQRYKDVARSVKEGRGTALSHYLAHGRKEGRLGVRPKVSATPTLPTSSGRDQSLEAMFPRHNGPLFLTPADLSVTPFIPKRLAFIGACLFEAWGFHRKNPAGCQVDILVSNNADPLPEQLSPGIAVSDYDFQVIQVPLRAVFYDAMLTALDYSSIDAHQKAFDDTCDRLAFHLKCRMEWNVQHGLLTFVCNFFVPQRNPMGVLFPRFDLRNPEYFIFKLNEKLEEMVRGYKNAYVLDLDRISASVGRRYVQDDSVAHFPHGTTMPMFGAVDNRMETMAALASHYEVKWPADFLDAVWTELMSMYRVVRQTDAVKLVVFDLDDTLWHGISGDIADLAGVNMLEGWPLGLAEAIIYLKKRGILLAIISKNEEQRIRKIWSTIFRDRLSLDDFAAVFINWDPKTENMRQLLEVVNLLPRNVVFIDDNPAERAAMAQVYPDMRVLGQYPYYLRRTLLWSAETQVVSLTAESSQRTEMVKAQVQREGERKEMSREDFLRQAAPVVTMTSIFSIEHPRFNRVFELINKTNQFNTTGRRWTMEAFRALLNSGAELHTFDVVDQYTNYGMVGVVIVSDGAIEQWAMSCRVLGYQIEEAVMATIVQSLRLRGCDAIAGRLIETEVNFPCRTLFSKCGFTREGAGWILLPSETILVPGHITVNGPQADAQKDIPPMMDLPRRSLLAGAASVVASTAPASETETRNTMLRFCSLGSNCELGQAQRVLGAEPLDLLRWAGVGYPTLLSLLVRRFEGIGDPDKLEVRETPGGLMVRNTTYGFVWHAFAAKGSTAEDVHAREVRRLPFLARKLMEDLADASRIFVIKPSLGMAVGEREATELLRMMESYGGRPTLMFVHDGAEAPRVTQLAPRLLHGQLVAFADQANVPRTTRSNDWLALCEKAEAMG
jgi:FkbH-like protein